MSDEIIDFVKLAVKLIIGILVDVPVQPVILVPARRWVVFKSFILIAGKFDHLVAKSLGHVRRLNLIVLLFNCLPK